MEDRREVACGRVRAQRAETRDGALEGSSLKRTDEVGSCDGLRRTGGQGLSSHGENKLMTVLRDSAQGNGVKFWDLHVHSMFVTSLHPGCVFLVATD